MPTSRDPDGAMTSRSRRALQRVRSHVRPGSFVLLLAASMVLYALNGLAAESAAGTTLVQISRAAVAGAGLYVLSASSATLSLGVIMLAGLALLTWHPLSLDPSTNLALQDSVSTAFLAWVLAVVLREIFSRRTSERDAVIGALCGFLLVIAVFMRIHGLLEALAPGAYQMQVPPPAGRSDAATTAAFQYFSTVTATTVGFGDIVPLSPSARLATGAEAIVGQLYLAVVIATLVGRVAARRD